MASSSSLTKLVFFACCLLLFTFSDNLVAGQSDKVQLNVYYDSLCSDCQDFIVNYLVEFFDSDLFTITNVTFVPFGNDELSDNQTVTCQHGEYECQLNEYEACIIRTVPDPKLQYSFIRCIENYTTNWPSSCFNGSAADKQAVISDNCYYSDLGRKLILGYANQTLSLNPKPDFVPWITVNGDPFYSHRIDDLVATVCTAYKGTASLPTQCSSTALAERKGWSKLQVSYANEAINY
ncbi:Gamma-interferon-responsive lysosomal thiol protein [Cardamine amara subsp. amara]|uniref:Gamma-interferon-responsive lysosomal thiol protein n=1 Tax=Cardamine amara subsp. amara TaxID=228776 RepID=A0ABD1CAD1_CARAN